MRAPLVQAALTLSLLSPYPIWANALEEIFVIATKRDENIQKVPIAVTGFGAAAISEIDIDDVMVIADFTPGFGVSMFNLGQPQLYIRGIGSNEDSAGGDASVVVYLDGVYLARPSASSFNFIDIDHIEVLRGPQGTLYGKNAIGGVVNIVTSQPHDNLSGLTEVTVGNFDYHEFRGSINIPLAQQWYSNWAMSYRHRAGYVENRIQSDELQDLDDLALHGKIRYESNNDWDFSLSVEREYVDRIGNGRHVIGNTRIGPFHSDDITDTQTDDDGFQKRQTNGISAEFNWQNSMGLFTSLTAYRKSEYQWRENLYGLPQGIGTVHLLDLVDETSEQYSQEFRFVADDSDSYNWATGIYYLRERAHRNEVFEAADLAPGALPDLLINGFDQKNETNSAAAFGEFTWFISDDWSLVIGGRYTYEKKEFQNATNITPFPAGAVLAQELFDISTDESWSAVTWKSVLQYQYNYDNMFYASVSKGFKSGGFQGQAGTEFSALKAFDPEYAINYELGMKTQWLQSALRLNIAAFYIDYSDLQVLQFVTVGNLTRAVTENAANAVSQGIEVELEWNISEHWQVFGFYAYNDTEYQDFIAASGDLSGNHLRNAPRNSASMHIRRVQPLSSGGELRALFGINYRDQTFQDVNNFEINKFKSRHLVDGKISYIPPDEGFEISMWGKNLHDEEYQMHTFQDSGGTESGQLYAMPRSYGVALSIYY